MLLKNKKVAIIGGGPGGLTLTRLLQEKGVNVKVFERDVNQYTREQGSTLDLHFDTGLKAVTAAGLLDEFKKLYRPGADKAVIVSSKMEILFDQNTEDSADDFDDENFCPEIDRGPLRDMLVDSIDTENIIWNAKFTQLKPAGDGWEIFFEDGTSEYADLIIAADGANSKLRKYITDIPAIYSGVTSIEENIPNAAINAKKIWELIKGGSLFALKEGKTIMFITKGDGTLTFLIGLKVPENWLMDSGLDLENLAEVKLWFKNNFSSWSPDWEELFDYKELSLVPRPWYHFSPDQYWDSLTNLTMIGDAAHRIPAYAGEGANQALADALDIYEALCCSNFETIQEAIASFEQKMFVRSAVATKESVRNTENFHKENNMEYMLDLFGVDNKTKNQ